MALIHKGDNFMICLKIVDFFKTAISGRLRRFVISETIKSHRSVREDLTHEILNFFTVRTSVSQEQIERLYLVIGPNWMKLVDVCEFLDKGYKFDDVEKMVIMGKI